jgi:RNA polymerase sigma factor (sigma-70 family)
VARPGGVVTYNLSAGYDCFLRDEIFPARPAATAVTIFPVMAIVDPRSSDSGNRERTPSGSRIDWPAALAGHGRWLRTVVLARVGEPQAVDEVLQNVAVAAIEHGGGLRDPTKVAPWLYRLAVVATLQYRRRQGRGKKLLDRYATRVPPSEADVDEPDPLDWLLSGEQRKLVRSALQQLPHRDAEILILKYTEDWSYRQLAEHLGLSTSAIEARLHRARHKLRRLLMSLDPSLDSAAK